MTQPAPGRPVAIDLAAVATPDALGAALDTLRLDRGLDSERAVARAAQGHGGLARATIKDMLNGTRVPTEASLRVFLNACGVAEASQVVAWLAARNRVAHDRNGRSDGTQRVRDASARQLGVHSAIASPSGADVEFLPAYVPRDTDDPYTDPVGVRARLRAAAATGGFILLVGESSVGKTRTAFEAIRAELGDWWLVHPDPGQLAILAADPPARTLVWLDELHRYVDRKLGLTKAVVDRLLKASGPIVLVATAWPSQYTAWTAAAPAAIAPGRPGDPYKEQRAVVALADMVRIAPTFSAAERTRAEEAAASGDARLRIALAHPEYGLTQTLAAAPQLVARWDHADPYARAVLTAAVDAARLGIRYPLTSELLKAMAPAYCTGRQRAAAPAGWFEAAMAYATELLHGAAAALVPDSGEGTAMGEAAWFRCRRLPTPVRQRSASSPACSRRCLGGTDFSYSTPRRY